LRRMALHVVYYALRVLRSLCSCGARVRVRVRSRVCVVQQWRACSPLHVQLRTSENEMMMLGTLGFVAVMRQAMRRGMNECCIDLWHEIDHRD
jgi:hypothetical protein